MMLAVAAAAAAKAAAAATIAVAAAAAATAAAVAAAAVAAAVAGDEGHRDGGWDHRPCQPHGHGLGLESLVPSPKCAAGADPTAEQQAWPPQLHVWS